MILAKILLSKKKNPYTPGQILVDSSISTPSSITLLTDGIYELRLVGGGGGASIVSGGIVGCGGSGSAFVGKVYLTKGTYAVSVGNLGASKSTTSSTTRAESGGSSNLGSAYAYGGVGGGFHVGGTGGQAPSIPYSIISSSINTAGNSGGSRTSMPVNTSVNGGASLYNDYGKGTGVYRTTGNATFRYGTEGYVYLAYES